MRFLSPSHLILITSVFSGISLAAYIPSGAREIALARDAISSNHTGGSCPMPSSGGRGGNIRARHTPLLSANAIRKDWHGPYMPVAKTAIKGPRIMHMWTYDLPKDYVPTKSKQPQKPSGRFCRDFIKQTTEFFNLVEGRNHLGSYLCSPEAELENGHETWTALVDVYGEQAVATKSFLETLRGLDDDTKTALTESTDFDQFYDLLVENFNAFIKGYNKVRGFRNKFELPKYDLTDYRLPKDWKRAS